MTTLIAICDVASNGKCCDMMLAMRETYGAENTASIAIDRDPAG